MKQVAKIVTCCALVPFTSLALEAPKFFFGLKGEFSQTTLETTSTQGGTTSKSETNDFTMPYMKLGAKGSLTDSVTYKIRVRLNKSFAAKSNNDNTSAAVDYAYFTKNFSDNLSMTVGKQFIQVGGLEGDLDAINFFSQGSFTWDADYYRVGLGMKYKLGKHTFTFQVANPADNTSSSKNNLFGGQAWLNFMDGKLQPVVSYYKDVDRADYQAGFRLDMKPVLFELDYLVTEFDKVAGDTKENEEKAITALLKYKMGKFVPEFRYTKAESEVFDKYDSYALVLRYYESDNFGYYLGYSSFDNTLKSNVQVSNTGSEKYRTQTDYSKEDSTIKVGFIAEY